MRWDHSVGAFGIALSLALICGCGGDDGKQSAAPESSATNAANSAAQSASAGGSDKGGGTSAATAAASAIDVSYVLPEDYGAIVVHPRRIADTLWIAKALKEPAVADAVKQFPIAPGEVDEIVFLMNNVEEPPTRTMPKMDQAPSIVVRFTHEVDAKDIWGKLAAWEHKERHEPPPVSEVQVAGKTCIDSQGAMLGYAPDKTTIVMAPRHKMEAILTASGPKGPLVDRLRKADGGSDLIVAIAPSAYHGLEKEIEKEGKGAPPIVKDHLNALAEISGATGLVDLKSPTLVSLTLDAKSGEDAAKMEGLLRQTVKTAADEVAAMKVGVPADMRPVALPLAELAEQCLSGAKLDKTDSQVKLVIARPVALESNSETVAAALGKILQKARAGATRALGANNLHMVALAMVMYESAMRQYPAAAIEKDGKPLLSWRVAILPYLDMESLYRQFHLDEPWDSPHNRELVKKMPPVYGAANGAADGKTRIMVFTGKGAAFDSGKPIRMMDIRDGASNTIMCVEAGPDKAVPWTKPEDLPFDPKKPLEALGQTPPEGFLAAFFDGSVQTLKVDNPTLKALITPNGGEPVERGKLRRPQK